MDLLGSDGNLNGIAAEKRGGPPNRMNDLCYRDWMKFQKSFFRHKSDEDLVEECIYFFTKARWPDGSPSRTLVVGLEKFHKQRVGAPRVVEHACQLKSAQAEVELVADLATRGEKFDFAMIDLRSHLRDGSQLVAFLSGLAKPLFAGLRQLLRDDKYCCVLVENDYDGGGGFPIPWSVALSARKHLRLRDEKIGLVTETGRLFYCLFMQAKDDERPSALLTPGSLRYKAASMQVPGWVIPKPPPRKKNEILHPAKYPETLVEVFIDLFTKPGDSILDPMVGTGSTVVAAVRKGRSGFGVDLNPRFVGIAARRAQSEIAESGNLFGGGEEKVTALVVQGDATKLEEVQAIVGREFQYVITSPPYWSMLANPGSENQESRRKKNLPLVYSADKADLGNVEDYDRFLQLLNDIYGSVAKKMRVGGILTVVVKNVKRNHVLYPLAWDLAAVLCRPDGHYDYLGTTFWCQDDVGLKPFAVGIHWVSNILHHYCLHFQKRGPGT